MSKGTIQLTTDRLTLRRHIIEDAEILHQNFGLDPEMFRYSGCSIELKSWVRQWAENAV